jgi:O-antigen ligase
VRFVLTCLLCGVVLESLIIIGLGIAGESVRIAGLTGRVDPYSDELGAIARFGGTVGSPNNAAAYLEMLLAPSLAVLATRMNWPYKVLGVLALVLGAGVLVLTQSRGGWIAGVFSLAIVVLSLSRGRRIAPAVPVVLIVLLSAIALVFHGNITSRLADDDRGAARSRVPLMVTAFDIIEDSPLFGVGANNYARALEGYRSIFGSGFFYTVHNQYLLVWAETGLLGLAAFVWFLLATLRRGWQLWKRNDALLSPLALGFTAALAGQMVHMQVDLFSSRPQIQLLVVVAALVGVMSRMEPREGHPGGRRAAMARTP